MALNSYLKIKGQKQGEIKGSVIQKGRENMIAVIAFEHDIVSPRDAASGLATGKRMHKPFVITKEIDKSSPLLHTAMTNNENLTTVELKCFAPSRAAAAGGVGTEVNHFTILLSNVQISSISTRMLNNKNPDLVKFEVYEEVSFVYQKISWTWVDGGITSEDNWTLPVV